jgi:hypothetical protein
MSTLEQKCLKLPVFAGVLPTDAARLAVTPRRLQQSFWSLASQ